MRRSGKVRYQTGRLLAMLGAAVLAAGCGGKSSTGPSNTTLTPNAATVQAALNTYTSGTVSIPASCAGGVGINCPGGTAGAATQLNLNRSGLTITQAAPDSFAYQMDLGVATQTPFTVTYSGIDCGFAVNTAAGTSPTVHVAGTATFVSQTMGGPINAVDLTTVITGAEGADVTVTGGSTCQALASNTIFVEAMLEAALPEGSSRLCSNGGGHFSAC